MAKPPAEQKYDPEMLRQLGRLVANFNHIEFTMKIIVWNLIDAGPDGRIGEIMTAGMNFPELCNKLEALYLYRVADESRRDRFTRLRKRLNDVNGRRKTLIHSMWITPLNGDVPLVRSQGGSGLWSSVSSEMRSASTNEIAAAADECANVLLDLHKLFVDYHELKRAK